MPPARRAQGTIQAGIWRLFATMPGRQTFATIADQTVQKWLLLTYESLRAAVHHRCRNGVTGLASAPLPQLEECSFVLNGGLTTAPSTATRRPRCPPLSCSTRLSRGSVRSDRPEQRSHTPVVTST